jgi:hypothetical protein
MLMSTRPDLTKRIRNLAAMCRRAVLVLHMPLGLHMLLVLHVCAVLKWKSPDDAVASVAATVVQINSLQEPLSAAFRAFVSRIQNLPPFSNVKHVVLALQMPLDCTFSWYYT